MPQHRIAPPISPEGDGPVNRTQIKGWKGMTTKSTTQIFEQFYGKSFVEITQADIGNAEELDCGEEVGGEVLV